MKNYTSIFWAKAVEFLWGTVVRSFTWNVDESLLYSSITPNQTVLNIICNNMYTLYNQKSLRSVSLLDVYVSSFVPLCLLKRLKVFQDVQTDELQTSNSMKRNQSFHWRKTSQTPRMDKWLSMKSMKSNRRLLRLSYEYICCRNNLRTVFSGF